MKNFKEWLMENNEERTTRHRVFPSKSFFAPKDDHFKAENPNLAYRITKQPQIDDILASGHVRAKLGKMRGGRTGETQWSKGSHNFSYIPQEGSYILVTNVEHLIHPETNNELHGGLPKELLTQVMYSDGEKWMDVTNKFKN